MVCETSKLNFFFSIYTRNSASSAPYSGTDDGDMDFVGCFHDDSDMW